MAKKVEVESKVGRLSDIGKVMKSGDFVAIGGGWNFIMSVTRHSIVEISRAVLPFVFVMLICLGLVTYLPSISMLLPNLVFRR